MAERTLPSNRGDVVISGVKYAVYINKDGSLEWKRTDAVDLQRGSSTTDVEEAWSMGFSGGMGETFRLAEDSMGYAYSIGVDCSQPGFARLSPAWHSLETPTADAGTWWDEARAPGNATFAAYTGLSPASPQSSTYAHGLGSTPKAIVIMCNGDTTDGTINNTHIQFSKGWSDGTRTAVCNITSESGAADSDTYSRYLVDGTIVTLDDDTGTPALVGTLTSIDATNVTINWTTTTLTSVIIHIKAYAGSDVSAYVKNWTTAAGTNAITGVGFRPDLVQHMSTANAAVGSENDARFSIGAMDRVGNQFATSVEFDDAETSSDTRRVNSDALCVLVFDNGGTVRLQANYVSMGDDGFTLQVSGASKLVSSLCIKGIRARIGVVAKKNDGTGNQAAVTLPFTTTAFDVYSDMHTAEAGTNNAALGVGWATGTSAVETCGFFEQDAQTTTSAYRWSHTTAAFLKQNTASATAQAVATCGTVSMGTAGWLAWGTNDAEATRFYYIAYAAAEFLASGGAAGKFIYMHQGNFTQKFNVASAGANPTLVETKDHGPAAAAGRGALFKGVWYQPLGDDVVATTRTVVAAVTDTWVAMAVTARAFANYIDSVAKLARAHTVNKVDLSADGTTWTAADFEIGETTTKITDMDDSGVRLVVAKEDNVYVYDPSGAAWPITAEPYGSADSTNGQGIDVVAGTEAVFAPYKAALFFWEGGGVPTDIGVDKYLTNNANFATAITHEPFRGRWLEGHHKGDWMWRLYQVTESSTTKTFLMAGRKADVLERNKWDTIHRFDGVARGCFIDSEARLWTSFNGTVRYIQLGKDGSPDAGRDAASYGEVSTVPTLYLPVVDFGLPTTLKYVRSVEVLLAGDSNANASVQIIAFRDDGASANIGTAFTWAAGRTIKYWTSAESAYRVQVGIAITLNGSFNLADLRLLRVVIRATPAPLRAPIWHGIIDTKAPYANGPAQVVSAKSIRDTLKTLENGAPVTVKTPDEEAISFMVTGVNDALLTMDGNPNFLVEVWGKQWVTS